MVATRAAAATTIAAILVTSMVLGIVPCVPATGNGAPSGAHNNLNTIGVPKEKNGGTRDNDGHRISVKLWSASQHRSTAS